MNEHYHNDFDDDNSHPYALTEKESVVITSILLVLVVALVVFTNIFLSK